MEKELDNLKQLDKETIKKQIENMLVEKLMLDITAEEINDEAPLFDMGGSK